MKFEKSLSAILVRLLRNVFADKKRAYTSIRQRANLCEYQLNKVRYVFECHD